MIERVFLVPLNYSHRQAGQIQAFEQIFGYRNVASHFDFMKMHTNGFSSDAITDELVSAVSDFKPDWIWMQIQETGIVQPRAVQAIKKECPKTLVTHWMGDLRTSIDNSMLADFCKVTDATLISNAGQFDMYKAAGAKYVDYVQIGLDWEADVLGWTYNPSQKVLEQWIPPFRVPDVVFCGGYYEHMPGHKLRVDAIRRLKAEGIDVGVVSESPWPSDISVVGSCHVKQQVQVYKRAKVALSISNYNDVKHYYSDRQLIAMASGTPVVCRYIPGLEAEFNRDEECIMFGVDRQDDDLDRMVSGVKWLLAYEDLARMLGQNGRLRVMRDHSWHRRIVDLLPFAEAVRRRL